MTSAMTVRELAAARGVSERAVERERTVQRNGHRTLVEAVERGDIALSLAETLALLPLEQQAQLVVDGRDACIAKARWMRRRSAWRHARDQILAELAKHATRFDLEVEADRRKLANVIATVIVAGGDS